MANERPNVISIGTPGLPWPTMKEVDKKSGGKTVKTLELSGIESMDNPLRLDSDREYAEVIGELYRNMPTRNMLPAFELLLHHARPDQKDHLVTILSDPGQGKSWLAMLVGRLMNRKGPIMAEAAGKSLESWNFQTVFDTKKSLPFEQAVDQALASNSLSKLSIKALRRLGKHFSETGDRKVVDWKGLSDDQDIKPDVIDKMAVSIRTYENWSEKSTAIGFSVQEGGLVQASKENRVFVGDEYNKSEPGSEHTLQVSTQVFNGEMPEHTVPLGGAGSHTFKRGGIPLVVFTGNLPKDGDGTRPMSDSFNRRAHPTKIPPMNEQDWQDCTSQTLAMFPLTMMQHLMRGKWEGPKGQEKWKVSKPDDFRDLLFKLSTYGMADEQKRNVTDWQLSFIGNWQNTLEASEKLGTFYHKWSQLVDPDSPLHQGNKLPDILLEIDNDKNPTEKITRSDMIRHIQQAQIISPEKKELERLGGFDLHRNWETPVRPRISEKEAVSANFGTRLVEAIMAEIRGSTIGKPNLYAQLMEDAKEAGLTGNPPPLAKLLNVDPSKDKAAEAKRVQRTHAALLRELYPNLGLSDIDEDLLPLRQVQAQLAAIETMSKAEKLSPFTTAMQVPNTNPQSAGARLYKRVAADSMDESESLQSAKKRLPAKSLTEFNTLLASLASPRVGAANLDALWNTAATKGSFAPDEATAMAEGLSPTGLATTSLLCRKGSDGSADYIPLHVLRNSKLGRTIVIGDEAISDEAYDQLKRNKVIYINRAFEGANTWIRSEIRGMVESQHEETVKEAFLLSNSSKGEAVISLAKLLSDPDQSKLTQPKFITDLDPEKITHAQRTSSTAKSRVLRGLI